MPQTLPSPLPPPPKTSIFDVTLTQTLESDLQGGKSGPGFLERWKEKFRQPMASAPGGAAFSPSDAQKVPGRPKSSIFDVTLTGAPEVAQKEAEEGLRFLERWFHGQPASASQDIPEQAEASISEADPMPAQPVGIPLRPKSSVFEQTLAGQVVLEPEIRERRSLLDRLCWWKRGDAQPDELAEAMEITAIVRQEPAYPVVVTTVLPDLPEDFEKEAFPVVAKVAVPAKPKPAPAPVMPKPVLPPPPKASILERPPAEAAAAKPALQIQSVITPPEADAWYEGTAMEWNPSWNERKDASIETSGTAEAEPSREERTRRFALPLLAMAATAAVALLGVKLWQNRTRAEAVIPVVIPEDLKTYHAKAEAGDVAAMRMLGLRYCYGIATPMNTPEGVKWLRKAAAVGNASAQRELAAMGIRSE